METQYPHVTIVLIAIIMVLTGALIWVALDAYSNPKETDKLYQYDGIDEKTCFEYYNGMWSNNGDYCLSKFPIDLIPCIDTSLAKVKNDGVFYCEKKDVDVSPDQMTCNFDVYHTRYCVLRET